MAVIGDDSLNPGPEPLAGFRHGVPVHGLHQRLHFLEQVLDFVWGFALTYNSETPYTKKSKRLQSGELGRPTSFSHTFGRFSCLVLSAMVPGDTDEPLWACGQDDQYAVAAPLVPFFCFDNVSADSKKAKNSPNLL
jgi:hypothetical protein